MTHEEVIEEHRKKIGATRFHVSYDPSCSPEDLRATLEKLHKEHLEWMAIPEEFRLRAEIDQLEKRLGRIADLVETDSKEFEIQHPEVWSLKQKIFEEVDILSIDRREAIEFCKNNGAVL